MILITKTKDNTFAKYKFSCGVVSKSFHIFSLLYIYKYAQLFVTNPLYFFTKINFIKPAKVYTSNATATTVSKITK